MTVITNEKIDLTKDGTPIVEIEDTGETAYSGAWLTAPEVHLKHSTDNANSEGVLGIIRFKGTTKTDLGIASDPGSVDLVQIQGRTVGQGNAQRYSDVKGALSFRGMNGAGGFAELMKLEAKDLTVQGSVLKPNAPAFSATPVSQSNVTGNGDAYTFTGSSTWTEIFDQNSNFTNGTFTAPVTGKYLFNLRLPLSGLSSSHSQCLIYLDTSKRTYIWTMNPANYYQTSLGGFTISFSQIADMDDSDTCSMRLQVLGGAKTVGPTSTYGDGAFTGMLLG